MTDLYNSFHSIEDDALYFKMYQIGVNREISERTESFQGISRTDKPR